MTKYAVAYTDEFNNVLSIEIVEADNWKDAFSMHSKMHCDQEDNNNLDWLPDELEAAKEEAFNASIQFDVIEIE